MPGFQVNNPLNNPYYQQSNSGGGGNPLSQGLQSAGRVNPLLAGLGVGLQGLSSLFPTQQDRDNEFSSEKLRELFGSEGASQFQGLDIESLLQSFNESLNLPQIQAGASRFSGLSSPESQRLFGGNVARLKAGQSGRLQELQARLKFSFEQAKKNRLVNIAGGLRG